MKHLRNPWAILPLIISLLASAALGPAAARVVSRSLANRAMDAFAEADSHGSVKSGVTASPRTMFDDVYATLPRHLRDQRDQVAP